MVIFLLSLCHLAGSTRHARIHKIPPGEGAGGGGPDNVFFFCGQLTEAFAHMQHERKSHELLCQKYSKISEFEILGTRGFISNYQ